MNLRLQTNVLALSVFGLAAVVLPHHASAQEYPRDKVSLYSRISLEELGAGSAMDCWGYVSDSGGEYAIIGLSNRTSFIDISDPKNPVIVGHVPHPRGGKDMKVYQHYVYSSTDSGPFQIIDVADIDNGVINLVKTIQRGTHNIALNEESGFVYLARGGPMTALDLSDPANPVEVGTWDGETHDAQVVTYTDGPYAGREIAFVLAGRSKRVDIVDVTNKSNMFLVGRVGYPNAGYTHQGWLSEDRNYFYVGDEFDERQGEPTTRTLVFDVSDLANPALVNTFTGGNPSVDHNLYVRDGFIFEANYTSGLQIFNGNADPVDPPLVGFFDTFPSGNRAEYNGAWSNFPYFPSGTVIVSDRVSGLFVLDVREAVGGGGIPCRDVKKFKAKCRQVRGKVKGKVKFTDEGHDGQSVSVKIGESPAMNVDIIGAKAKFKKCCHKGKVTVSLEKPDGCVDPIDVDCG